MTGRSGYQLAELNVGRLVAPTDDPRVADFMAALDRVNGLGKRDVGICLDDGGIGRAQHRQYRGQDRRRPLPCCKPDCLGKRGNAGSLCIQHGSQAILRPSREMVEVLEQMHFVMWWVPKGHCPGLDEVLARLSLLREHGPSEIAFGWVWLKEARSGQSRSAWTSAKLSGGGQHHPRLA